MRGVLAAMQITEVNEYRREVSEVRDMKEMVNNVQFSNLSQTGQKSILNKYEKSDCHSNFILISQLSKSST